MPNQSHTYSQLSTTARVNWRVDDFCHAHGIGRTYFYNEVKIGEIGRHSKQAEWMQRDCAYLAGANDGLERCC